MIKNSSNACVSALWQTQNFSKVSVGLSKVGLLNKVDNFNNSKSIKQLKRNQFLFNCSVYENIYA